MEIDDAEYQRLTASRALLDRLLTPKTKRKTEALIKEHYPDTITEADNDPPEIAQQGEQLAALRKDFKEYLDGQRQREDDAATSAAFARLEDAGYTKEGIDWIKKTMVDRKIPDPEAAAALYDKQHPPEPQKPAGYLPQGWGIGLNPDKDADLDLLLKDEEAWSDREIGKVLGEIRQQQK